MPYGEIKAKFPSRILNEILRSSNKALHVKEKDFDSFINKYLYLLISYLTLISDTVTKQILTKTGSCIRSNMIKVWIATGLAFLSCAACNFNCALYYSRISKQIQWTLCLVKCMPVVENGHVTSIVCYIPLCLSV